MIKPIHIIVIFIVCGCNILSPRQAIDTLEMKDGYQLNYNLAADGERYQFIVNIITYEPYFQYQGILTKDNQISATQTFTPHAMEYAFAQKVKLKSVSETLKDHIITGMFSRKTYRELLSGDTALIVPDADNMDNTGLFVNNGFELYSYELNGEPQTIEVMRVVEVTKTTPRNYLILNNAEQPLIIKMDIGYTIALKEINYVSE